MKMKWMTLLGLTAVLAVIIGVHHFQKETAPYRDTAKEVVLDGQYLAKSILGKESGQGYCRECFKRWDEVNPRFIPYSKNAAMFPLCKFCFRKLDSKEITRHCFALIARWEAAGFRHPHDYHNLRIVIPEVVAYLKNGAPAPSFLRDR